MKITAMVQDMSSPEYFALKYEAEDTFKPGCFRPMTGVFRDELPVSFARDCHLQIFDFISLKGMPEELKSFIPAERISLHCVEVPGETDWVRKKVSESKYHTILLL